MRILKLWIRVSVNTEKRKDQRDVTFNFDVRDTYHINTAEPALLSEATIQ